MKPGHHTWPYSGEEHPVWMKHEEEPVNDYNKRMKEYITDLVKQEVIALGETKKKDSRGTVRDYKKEYAKYGSSSKAKKYRAELNKYNRKKGTYGNGDGKDASHKGGKIVGFESQSKNRGRAEKSRLKQESLIYEIPSSVFSAAAAVKLKNKAGKEVSAATAAKSDYAKKDPATHKKAKSIFQRLKDKFSKKKDAKPKKQSKSDADFYKRQYAGESVNEANIKDIEKVLKTKSAKKIDGMYMDMTTANAIMTVYKALNTTNKKKFAKLPLKKMVDVTWKLVK